MSLSSSLFAGVGGLLAYGEAMNVIGDNISNVNTIGFKGSRTIFGDILASSMSSGITGQIGRGASIRSVNQNTGGGSIESTGNATDVAIQGNGYFILKNSSNDAKFYSRAGQFILNKDGLLVGPRNLVVQGFELDVNGNSSGEATDINLAGVNSAPQETTSFQVSANLNAASSAATTFLTSMTVINSLGEQVTLTTTFTKSATVGTWDYSMAAATSNASSGTLTVTGGAGSLVFDSSGTLTTANSDQTVTIAGFPSGAADLAMTWDLMDNSGVSNADLTSFAASSVTNSITQDGHSTGTLKGISISEEGIISGIFSNGQSQELMQLALADFQSPWGLSRQGNSLYAESAESGQPTEGTADTGRFGSIVGSSLEQSNVDLGTEFVNLITTQRAYQANSRIITSVNEMLVEAVNLVR